MFNWNLCKSLDAIGNISIINQNSPEGFANIKSSNSFSSPTRHKNAGMLFLRKKLFVSIPENIFTVFGLIETWTILALSIYLFSQGLSDPKLCLFLHTNIAQFQLKPKKLINRFLHKKIVWPFLVCSVKRFWGQQFMNIQIDTVCCWVIFIWWGLERIV